MTRPLGWVTACVAVLASLFFLYPLAARIRRRNQGTRPDGIQIISDPVNAKFQVVAVHGLGAHPEHTWTCDVGAGKIHLLRDLLAESFPEARILSFAHNSDWLINAPIKTAQEIGERLLDQLVKDGKNRRQRLRIVFIGHSFGGIIIKQALCRSAKAEQIIRDTSGILFLGTPHQGSPLSVFGSVIAWATGFLGSSTGLLFTLQHHSSQLSDLDSRFDDVRKSLKDAKIYSIYETMPSYAFGWLSLGLIVSRNSAKGPADETTGVNTDHSGLNKCPGESSELYEAISRVVKDVRQRPSLLERGDRQIRDSYTEKKLSIERLSGHTLPMNQCYINLSIVQQNMRPDRVADEFGLPNFRVSLLEKLNIEEPDRDLHVNLSSLFEPRRIRNEVDGRPRRILIRGRPGVGKTTLCKKIVHDFIHCQQWSNYFTRLIWIPLRNLQGRQERYKITDLLHDEYFPQYKDPEPILDELYEECKKPDAGGTLFLLDGLDEIWQHQSPGNSKILQELLDQPNVIVTSRPSVQLLTLFKPFDLELETIGFYSNQVREYVQQATGANTNTNVIEGAGKSRQILDFLDQHPLIGDLVRIPIQLDALCFAWDDLSGEEPQTMTNLYQAIEAGLWIKDAHRLGRTSSNHLLPAELEGLIKDEVILLEKLAFAGLYNDLTVFDAKILHTLSEYLAMPVGKTIDQTLRSLSFLRSSDVSSSDASRRYYFLHLTLQEYFAARHLTRMWVGGTHFELPNAKREREYPDAFLRRYKYLEKFDIVWRFMAGLLSSNTDHQIHYFQIIQAQPLDLLGPAHHRLLMRCLFEIPPSDDMLRKQFESQLLAWSAFEYSLPEQYLRDDPCKGFLATEIEFPIGLLLKLLQEGEDELRIHLVRSINPRRILPTEIVQLAVSWLKNSPNQELVLAVLSHLGMFLKHLPSGYLGSIQQQLEKENADIPSSATPILDIQSNILDAMVQVVVAKLEDTVPSIRHAAVQSLQDELNLPVVLEAVLVAKLEDQDYDVRRAAVLALRNKLNRPPILHAVIVMLEDKDPDIQKTALTVLKDQLDIPIIFESVLAKLEDNDFNVQHATINALQCQRNLPERILQVLVTKLKDKSYIHQAAIIGTFQGQANLPETILQQLVAKLEDEDSDTQWAAVKALQAQSNLPEIIVQRLAAMLENADSHVQLAIIMVMRNQSSLSETVLQVLVAEVDNEDSHIWEVVAVALQNQSHLPETALQALEAKLESKDHFVLRAAIRAFRKQSNLPETMLQALVTKVGDKNRYVRWATKEILQNHLNSPAILQAVAAKLEDPNSKVRLATIIVLENQLNLPAILEAVVARLEDKTEHPDVRLTALTTLWHQARKQSNLPETVNQAVIAWLEDEGNSAFRYIGIGILREQSTLPDSALPTLSSFFEKYSPLDLKDNSASLLSLLKKCPKLLVATSKVHNHFKRLVYFLLQQSFERHLAWYHYDNKLHLVIDGHVTEYEGEDPCSLINELAPDLPDYGQKNHGK